MTRKQLTNGLRVLHENDQIIEIKTIKRTGAVQVNFLTGKQGELIGKINGLLLIADPSYGTTNPTKPPNNS